MIHRKIQNDLVILESYFFANDFYGINGPFGNVLYMDMLPGEASSGTGAAPPKLRYWVHPEKKIPVLNTFFLLKLKDKQYQKLHFFSWTSFLPWICRSEAVSEKVSRLVLLRSGIPRFTQLRSQVYIISNKIKIY